MTKFAFHTNRGVRILEEPSMWVAINIFKDEYGGFTNENLTKIEEVRNADKEETCKCKDGPTGRTVTSDYKYQICNTCGCVRR